MKYALLLAATAASSALAQSPMSPNSSPPAAPRPMVTRPATPAPDMAAVLAAHASLMPKPIEALTPVQARIQPSAADATMKRMRQLGMSTAPDPSVKTQDLPYGSDPMQFARVYRPANAPAGPLPVIIYYHGGGWVIADVNTYDAAPRLMSQQLNAIVVSVEYRKAPEAKFPAQHDDAAAAYRWTLDNAAAWGGDTGRMALAGESAGGNLAIATAIYARDNRLPMPRAILSVYPIADSRMNLPSRKDSANAKPLNGAMLNWFGYYYTSNMADMRDPRLDLVNANLRGLPPVTIVNAKIDPLRSDGENLARALSTAGNRVEQRTFAGVTHEFFGMGRVVRGAHDAEMYAIDRLRPALAR